MANADQSVFLMRKMAPKYEAQAEQLRRASAKQCDFDKALLGDVLRFLAKDAGINFISLPEDSPESKRVVSFSIQGSPFTVLETLCKAHTLALIPDGDMWYIRPADDRELIGKGYEVKYNPMERIQRNTEQNNAQGQGVGTLATSSIDLQGTRETYTTGRSELIDDLRAILDLPKEDQDEGSTPEALSDPNQNSGGKITVSNELSALHRPKVLWKSDSNMLYVVATRLQHMWVEGYLTAADKPQALIAIEAKFIETNRDPSKEFGVDWGGVFGANSTYREITGVDDNGRVQFETRPNTDGGLRGEASLLIGENQNIRTGDSPLINPDTLRGLARSYAYPSFSVLSAQDLNLRLRALLNDEATSTTSYPRMVTLNNREVAIKSVVNQPVLSSSGVVGGSGGTAAVQTISYLPIGTVLNILPKKMQNDEINLNVGIVVSSIIGEQLIDGNRYPVATSRVYNAPVQMPSGYTAAIGGLDEAKERTNDNGVPLLSKVPILGYAFKSKSRSKNHKTLMLFITPTLIDARDGGLPDEPQSVVRQNPSVKLPQKPQVDNAGNLVGGPAQLSESIAYLSRELDIIDTTIKEGRSTEAESKKLTEMKLALNQLDSQIENYLTQYPDSATELVDRSTQVQALHDRVKTLKSTVLKKSYY
jgi:type II secretory pathway component GspD/PulD (secretin)